MNHTSLDKKLGNSFRFALNPLPYVLIFTLCTLLSASFALAADKLVVKDSGGNTKFVVTDEGKVGIGTTSPGQSLSVIGNVGAIYGTADVGAFGASDIRNVWFARNAYFDASGWQRFDASKYVVLDQQFSSGTGGEFQIYTAAPGVNPISNWVKQFGVDANGKTFINGNVGLGTTTPTQVLDVNSNGIRIRNSKTPISSADVCNQGDMAWDSNYVYVCISSNLWKRASLGTW